jgi:hypothetical protein
LEFSVMRKSNWTPSIVPRGDEQDVYLVVDDLGRLGWIWREAEYETTDFETVILDLLDGQYKNPIGCFDPFEGCSRDVSADVAGELRRHCDLHQGRAVHAIRRGSVRKSRPPTQLSCHSVRKSYRCRSRFRVVLIAY